MVGLPPPVSPLLPPRFPSKHTPAALALSLKAERHLEALLANPPQGSVSTGAAHSTPPGTLGRSGTSATGTLGTSTPRRTYGLQYQHREDGNAEASGAGTTGSPSGSVSAHGLGASSALGLNAVTDEHNMEEQALRLAIEEVWEESGRQHRPWAANGRATRMGEIVLIVDSDTVVPEVRLLCPPPSLHFVGRRTWGAEKG
jgi:hypothetical protein